MRRIFILLQLAVFASPLLAETDALDSALTALNISRNEFRVDPEVLLTRNASTAHRLPIFDQWFQHPLRIPFWERHYRNSLLDSGGKLHPLFNTCSAMLSLGTRRDLIPPTPLEKYQTRSRNDGALADAVHELDPAAQLPGLQSVPPVVQQLTAMCLFAIRDAVEWREMALRNLPQDSLAGLFTSLAQPLEHSSRDTTAPDTSLPDSYARFYSQQDLLSKVDLRLLCSAGDDLSAVVDTVAATLSTLDARSFDFNWICKTRLGVIRLSSGRDDRYEASESLLLVLDLSGNDTYSTGGGTPDERHPISIIIDAGGNDTYVANGHSPCFGAAILGFGLLLDCNGNDEYRSANFYSQGCGVAGVGLLRDMAGNDTYDAIGASQGFGYFGIGILSDQSGNDTYHSYTESQGCGMTNGMGLLLDVAGDDRYVADDSDIIFPSPQSAEHNASMCQGAGYGIRRDYLDAHSLAGGVGMLLDAQGNDQYSGGVFSQAVGYWYGIGILDDRTGDDTYNGVWYAQSATAHMGISYLNDGAGNDTYTSTMSVSAGAAHDFSASIFYDEAGDDSYHQTTNALGRSLNSSVALFVDQSGDDTYEGKESIGQSVNFSSTGLRAEIWTIALFLDLDGKDKYPENSGTDNSIWQQSMESPLPLLKGLGADSETLNLSWD